MDCPPLIRRGTRLYASDCSGEQQAYLIDRLSTLIEIECEDGTKVKARVRSVRDDKAILEVVAE